MNTFYGCDTAALDDLSSHVGERAVHLGTVLESAGRAASTTAWFGPDGQRFREQVDELVEKAIELFDWLRELGELLGSEALEQTACSEPDGAVGTGPGGPRAIRAELPVPDRGLASPAAGARTESGQPVLGGPFMVKDPVALADRLPPLPDLGGLGPLIGGPLMPRDPLRPFPAQRPVPEGEEFALDPEILAEAQKDRRLALGGIPIVGTAQLAMGIHDGIDRFYDHTEHMLESSGLGAVTPLISMVRMPHHLAGIPFGGKSVPGQAFDVVDRQIANVVQTSGEVSSAIGEGDWNGATRAVERGMFRHADASADLLTANPGPAIAEAAAGFADSAANIAEPVSPAAAEPLRDIGGTVRDAGIALEDGHHWLTDGERYYDLRRQYLPMPWDPQS